MASRAAGIAVRIVVALAVIGGVIWYLARERGGSAATPGGPAAGAGSGGGADRVVAVQVAPAVIQSVPIWLEGLGTVAAAQQVTVRPQVDGRIDKVFFTEGQMVKAGALLAQIDPRPYQVQLHQAQGALARDRAQLTTARKNQVRYQGLVDQKLVAQQQLDEITAQVGQFEGSIRIDQAQVEAAQLNLDFARIKSPIDGVTGVRLVDAGNLVRASDTTGLVVVTSIDPAAVLFTVPQDKLQAVAAAMAKGKVAVEVWNRDGTQLLSTGEVAVLDNQVNASTGTLRLKALAPNPDRLLWPNAFVKARMLLETREQALVIPAVAVQRGPQGAYVYVVSAEKTAVMTPIEVAMQTGESALIAKGLRGGEQVVIEGANQIRPGGRVEPVKPTGGSASASGGSGSETRNAAGSGG